MSTPFLIGFTGAVLAELKGEGLVEVQPGREESVIQFVAHHLGRVSESGSLISSMAAALLDCPDIIELYADDAELKRVITELRSTPAHWVRS